VGRTTTYCYDTDQPHALDATTIGGDCGAPDKQYGYDPTGNTTSRPDQTLTWNSEGNLASVTDGTTKTSYLYDAGGSLLIRDTAGGERVLYVGSTELHLKADGTLWAQRYYIAGASGTVIAVRTNATGSDETYYLAGDAHGTTTLAVKSDADQAFIKRSLPPSVRSARRPACMPGSTTRASSAKQPTPAPDSPTSAPANTTLRTGFSSPSPRYSRPTRHRR